MKISVFCSSSNRIAEHYKRTAFQLGEKIALGKNTLVFGGATGGLMDAVAEGAQLQNGEIIGVIPQSIIRMKRQSPISTQIIEVESMNDRKATMKALADAFIVLPGSYGTLDEMFDIISSGIVGEHTKPLVLINQDGFYNQLISQIDHMRAESFIPVEEVYSPFIVDDINQCLQKLNLSIIHSQK
jgi:cytokinin riboside 5'-monophosphate phosphoribohydrolase